VNVTVDDFDPAIVYSPAKSWNSSQVVCSVCDNPPVLLASEQTYHKGVHVVILDGDDGAPKSTAPSSSAPPISSAASQTQPAGVKASPSSTPPDNDKPTTTGAANPPSSPTPPDDDKSSTAGSKTSVPASSPSAGAPSPDDDSGSGKPATDHDNDADDKSGKGKNPARRNIHAPRLDGDDPGFVDTPVFASYNFTGTSVYIFCIQPLGLTVAPAPPSLINLTVSLDNVASTIIHQGSSTGSGFASGVNVFAKQGLTDGPHVLKLNLGPNSVFILDYILVTQNVPETPVQSGSPTAPVQSQLATSIADADGTTTMKGRASFAGAVAGSLGVLGILCFGTAFSIYRRRKLAARRERLQRGNAPPPAPMSGPASFIPRYFPGTVVSTTPPPYAASDASSSNMSHIAPSSEPLLATHPEQTYADIPPPLEELAPPSFGVAITTPAVTLLSSADFATPPPRPLSWGAEPRMVALPPSIAPASRTTSLFSADAEDHV
jgi:hypothetical protein